MLRSMLLVAATGAAPPAAAPAPAIVFEARTVDFGEAYQFAFAEGTFRFTNRGARPVTVMAEPLLRESTATVRPRLVPPGSAGAIEFRVPVGDRLGRAGFRLHVTTDDPGSPEAKLTLTGFVQSAYGPESGLVDFGFVERRLGAERRFELSTLEAPAFSAVGVDGAPAWLAVRATPEAVAGQTATLALEVRPGAPLGRHSGTLRVRTDLKTQPEYRLRYAANVFDAVVPSENPVDLGFVRVGASRSRSVRLASRDGRPVVVERVTQLAAGLSVTDGPCQPPADAACRLVTFVAAPVTASPMQGRVLIHLRDEPEPLPLDFAAIVAGRNANVTELGDLTAPLAAAPPVRATPSEPEQVSPPPAAGSMKSEAQLTWEAAKESMTFGYLVYRAESRQGPFVRASSETIRVPADGEPRHVYRWVDTKVKGGSTYYYYIDAVGTGGVKQRFSPVVSKTIAGITAVPSPPVAGR